VNNQRDATLFYLVYYHSTCFRRGSRPSSGVIYKTVLAATCVCHTCGGVALSLVVSVNVETILLKLCALWILVP
jgi:hypothetical protein